MQIKPLSGSDPLIDRLVADLRPVAPRRWRDEALLLAALGVAEVLMFVMLRGVRGDMAEAMAGPMFWWKSGSLAIIAALAGAAALLSLDPAAGSRPIVARLWWWLGTATTLALGAGWLVDAGSHGRALLIARLNWPDGLDCLANVALLSVPPVLALAVMMRRGASVQPARTAGAAGLAAAGFAAFVFAFHCPHDDPLYVAVWYGTAVIGIAGLARLVLPRFARW
jgi:hypothetical protein